MLPLPPAARPLSCWRASAPLLIALCALAPSFVSAQPLSQLSRKRVADQLDEDLSVVPKGMGALFLPSLSSAEQEPGVIVYSGADRVAAEETAKRIALPPGEYRVIVGSGTAQLRPELDVEVRAGATTTVEPFYGGIRLYVVTPDGLPTAGEGVLTTASGERVLTFDLDDDQTRTETWLLKPGAYYLSLDDDDEGRIALTITEGQLMEYRMTVDEGELLGSGFGMPKRKADNESPWDARWVLGGTGTFDRRSHSITGFNGDMLFISVFSRGTLNFNDGTNVARFSLFVDQSFGGVDNAEGQDAPFRWLTSRTEAEALYQYKILESPLAPYVRGVARTSIAPTHFLPADDTVVERRSGGGSLQSETTYGRGDRVDLLSTFSPLSFQEGVGVGLSVVDNDIITLEVRGGVAARQAYYDGGYYLAESGDDRVVLQQFENNRRYGGEVSAVAELRINRRFSIQSRFDAFAPHQQLLDDEELRPVFYWDSTFAAKIGSFASVVYDISLARIETVVPRISLTSGLAVRVQHALF